MAHVIEFKTAMFDVAQEPVNPINPIAGQSVLAWLREHVLPNATAPDYEDWGWYIEVQLEGTGYLIGSICFEPDDGAIGLDRAWVIQIHKNRSFVDRLLGRNRLQFDDPLVARIVGTLRSNRAFRDIEETADA